MSDETNAESTVDSTTEPAAEMEPLSNSLPSFNDWVPEALVPAWNLIDTYPIVGALMIAGLFYLIAMVVTFVIFNSLERLSKMTRSPVDDIFFGSLRSPVFVTISLFGLSLAIKAAALPAGEEIAVNVVLSLIILKWMRSLLHTSTAMLHALGREHRFSLVETRTIPMFDLTCKVLVILVGSYILMLIWSINPVGWLASAGIVGIAVGFAAKDTLANLFAGFFIVADAPYKIGDYINLDTGERGKVAAIGLRSTRLLTRDDIEITVPNGVIANAKIINESGGPSPTMRLRIAISTAYGSDVDQVCAVLQEVGEAHDKTRSDPAPRVRMRSFGASGLNFELLCWIDNPPDRGRIIHELNMNVYKALAGANIEIPYTKTDLYIKEWPER